MTIGTLAGIDFSSWEQPDPNLEPRELLESWLRYQRHEFTFLRRVGGLLDSVSRTHLVRAGDC